MPGKLTGFSICISGLCVLRSSFTKSAFGRAESAAVPTLDQKTEDLSLVGLQKDRGAVRANEIDRVRVRARFKRRRCAHHTPCSRRIDTEERLLLYLTQEIHFLSAGSICLLTQS
jgi:hypothetical protein